MTPAEAEDILDRVQAGAEVKLRTSAGGAKQELTIYRDTKDPQRFVAFDDTTQAFSDDWTRNFHGATRAEVAGLLRLLDYGKVLAALKPGG
jgi:hypothetical protein